MMRWIASLGVGMLLTGAAWASSDSVVVFNEIMYHPVEGGTEWVELHNQMTVDIDLSRWRIDGGIDYAFAEGTIIPGGGYLVIAADPQAVEDSLGPFNRKLSNAGEPLRLYSASDRLMNEVVYADDGEWPVGPDGSGFSLAKVHRDSTPEAPENWWWSAEKGGTPGAVNFPEDRVMESGLRINEIGGAAEEGVMVELFNAGETMIALEGHTLFHGGADQAWPLPNASLAPGAFLTMDIGGADTGDQLFLFGPDHATLLDAFEVKRRARGRTPDGEANWAFVSETTLGDPNAVDVEDAIVINEILYHHRPQYRNGETPFRENEAEWIELYHRGEVSVDLTGWELAGDIAYVFPEGSVLEPEEFWVIERSEDETQGFSGRLSNRAGVILLQDANGNLADEVRYFDNGDWPKEADAGGSSLELRDPRADNASASAWAASDESARTEWQEIVYRGVAESSRVGRDNQWRDFVIGLLDEGEILIDDIQVVEDPDGRKIPFINNSTFQSSIFGGGPLRNWRLRGNHRHGEVVPDPEDPSNNVLRLVATGATEHMHNHVEITLSGGSRVTNGETYEIRYRARPVSGSPQVLTRLYFNRLARTTVLATPTMVGTPGMPNSRLEANLGPTFTGLTHQPAVPKPGESTSIEVRVADPDGVAGVTLHWAVDGGAFETVAMEREESLEGVYRAAIGPQAADAVVQFFVEAEDAAGAVALYPAAGEASRALYQVLEESRLDADSRLNPFRIIMLPSDVAWLHTDINLMSNDRVPGTVIYKEQEIFYNVGVRLKGSERGRVTVPRLGFNVQFPSQNAFRGVHRTVAVDRSEGVGFGQFEMLFNQMMTHSGSIPAEYNDLIYVISPQDRHTGAAELQLARYGAIFLDSQFDNGSDGNLYEYELVYYPTTDDADGNKRPQPDSVVGSPIRDLGDDPEAYRWIYLLKNNRERDDFFSPMQYAKLFSMNDTEFQETLPELVDVDRWLQGMALALLSGSGDQYGANSQHNGMFYQRPDGKFIFFPHDLDFAHQVSRSITENTDLRKIIRNPAYERMYLGHVHNILETTFNESYMTRWAEHFGDLLPGQNFSGHLNYVVSRSKNAKSQLNRMAPQASFSIQTGDGEAVEVDTLSVEIQGTGGLNLYQLQHEETGALYQPQWLDMETWAVTLPLQSGENVFSLQGLDVLGTKGSLFSPVGRGVITVTTTATSEGGGDEAPVRMVGVRVDPADGGQVIVTYERSTAEGLAVTAEVAADLQGWSEVEGAEETVEAVEEGWERVTLTFPANAVEEAEFVRLRSVLP